jgi:hypothetical protein
LVSSTCNLTGSWADGSPDGVGGTGTLCIVDTGGVLTGSAVISGITFVLAGSVSGNSVTFTLTYRSYVATDLGTVSDNCQLMGGTFSDTNDTHGTRREAEGARSTRREP